MSLEFPVGKNIVSDAFQIHFYRSMFSKFCLEIYKFKNSMVLLQDSKDSKLPKNLNGTFFLGKVLSVSLLNFMPFF